VEQPLEGSARALAHLPRGGLGACRTMGWDPLLGGRGGGRRGPRRGVTKPPAEAAAELRAGPLGSPLKWSSRVMVGTFESLRGAPSGAAAGAFERPVLDVSSGRSRGRAKAVLGSRRASCSWSQNVVSSVLERGICGCHRAVLRPSQDVLRTRPAVSARAHATLCDSRLRARREARRVRGHARGGGAATRPVVKVAHRAHDHASAGLGDRSYPGRVGHLRTAVRLCEARFPA
jgi:hypothetical protein